MDEPHVKPLGKKLYFAARNRRFVIVHGFQKKTQKTPKQELEKALKRMTDFLATDFLATDFLAIDCLAIDSTP